MRMLRMTLMKCKAMIGGAVPLLAALLLVLLCSLTVRETLTRQSVGRIGVAVVDLDESAFSRALIASLAGGGALEITETDAPGAARQLARGRAEGILTVPSGCGRAAENAEPLMLRYEMAPFAASADAAREIIASEALMQQAMQAARTEAEARGWIDSGDAAGFDAVFAENRRKTEGLVSFSWSDAAGGAAQANGAVFSNAASRSAGFSGLLLMLLILSLSQFLSAEETRLVNRRLRIRKRGRLTAFATDNAALLLLSLLLCAAAVPFAIGGARLSASFALYGFAVAGLASLLAGLRRQAGGTDALLPFLVLITSLVGGCFFDPAAVAPALVRISLCTPQGLLIAASGGSGWAAALLACFGTICFILAYFTERARQ